MDRPLTNCEFFTFESEVWYRLPDRTVHELRETDYDVLDDLIEHIATFYPKAYDALCVHEF